MSDREGQLRLAKLGLRALIDEATGFQEEREPDDLRKYAHELGIGWLSDTIDERIRLALSERQT